MKKENLTISEIKDLVKKVISEKNDPKKELRDTYEKLKKVRKELKERGKSNSDLKKYKCCATSYSLVKPNVPFSQFILRMRKYLFSREIKKSKNNQKKV